MNLRNRLPFLLYASKYQDLIVKGTDKLDLQNALKDWLYYVNAYGKSVQSNVPYDYRELEYIESTGTQYIDTGITNENCDTYGVKTKYYYTAVLSSSSLCGNYEQNTGKASFGQIFVSAAHTSDAVFTGIGNVSTCARPNVPETTELTDEFTINCTAGTISRNFNGESLSGSGLNFSVRSSRHCLLFACNSSSGAMQHSRIRLSYFQILKDSKLVFNGIPCINPTGQIGMYDTVTQQFFSNLGTGEFIAGPEIVASLPSPYVRIDYVNMQAGSYVITNIIPKSDYNIEIDFKTTTVQPQNTCYFGTRSATSSGSGISAAHTNSAEAVFDVFGQRFLPTVTFSNDTRYLYSYNNGTISLSSGGSVLYTNTTTPTNIVTHPFIINALNNIGTAYGNYEGIYLYSFKVRDNTGKLIADYVPARIDTRAFLYDRVTNQTFIQDAGTWEPGPDTTITYIPTPNNPVDIWCNNGVLKWDSTNQSIYTDGTVETIGIFGENIFNSTGAVQGYLTQRGSVLANSASSRKVTDFIAVKPNTTYVVYGGTFDNAGYSRLAVQYDNTQTKITDVAYSADGTTFTTAANCESVRIQYMIATETRAYIEVSSTATCEDLLSISTYTDEQEIISGGVTRKVGVKVLDGTENWTSGGGGTGVWTSFQSITGGAFATANAFCSHSIYGGANISIVDMNQNEFGLYTNGNISFKNAYATSTSDWATFLANQYNVGTPVIIVYLLATETTSTVSEQPLQLENGDNVLQITEASLDHLKLEAKYRKRK